MATGTIWTKGGNAFGFGHLVRMKYLGKALMAKGIQVDYLCEGDSSAWEYLKTQNLSVFPIRKKSEIREKLAEVTPDLLIIDKLELDSEDEDILRGSKAKKVLFDNQDYSVDLVDMKINALVDLWKPDLDQAINPLENLILNPEIYRYRKDSIGEKIQHIFLAFGATDNRNYTTKFLQLFDKLEGDFKVHVNIGPGNQNLMEKTYDSKFIFYNNPSNLFEIMKSTDLALCGGGVMMMELMYIGVLVAPVATEVHEQKNIDFFLKRKAVVNIGNIEQDSVTISSIESLLNQKIKNSEIIKNAQYLIDGKGLERIIQKIEGILK